MVSAVAILCTRNEELHIRRCLACLIDEGLDIVMIDNDSSDRTRAYAAEFLGRGLLSIESLPWRRAFSLSDQLASKAEMIKETPHDWIVHVDADEWLSSSTPGQTLMEGLVAADAAGANCINFDEFVFTPPRGESVEVDDYHHHLLAYYFFQPAYPRLLRAWRKDAALDNQTHAGHNLSGPNISRFPKDFILRHYIVLSEAQARTKYVGRKFSPEDISRGWHGNRTIIRAENMILPPREKLNILADWTSKSFSKEPVHKTHFWQWDT
jgi:glycosyltransferase involved in cell wall biosynthesis